MATTNRDKKSAPTVQCVNIDLPGETVRCWRSSDNIQVVLRKHRDVIFDINLQPGVLYTIESAADFYIPKNKKLLRKFEFNDGEQCHIWVGREFQAKLVLKVVGMVLGTYEVNQLDAKNYGADPKTKPEPLMIIMGKKEAPGPFRCTPDDPYGIGKVQKHVEPSFNSKFSMLRNIGTEFDYVFPDEAPDVKEYVVVTEALLREIQPQVVEQLERNVAVVGSVGQIFISPKNGDESYLLTALTTAAKYVSGSDILTDNTFKETAGYVSEHFKMLDKIFASVRIERRAKGAYQVAIKGYPPVKKSHGFIWRCKNYQARSLEKSPWIRKQCFYGWGLCSDRKGWVRRIQENYDDNREKFFERNENPRNRNGDRPDR